MRCAGGIGLRPAITAEILQLFARLAAHQVMHCMEHRRRMRFHCHAVLRPQHLKIKRRHDRDDGGAAGLVPTDLHIIIRLLAKVVGVVNRPGGKPEQALLDFFKVSKVERSTRSARTPKRIKIGFHRLNSAAWVTETFGSMDLRRCCSREENIRSSACASRVHLWTVLAPISSTTGIDLLRSATGIDGFLLTRTCFPELNHGKRSLNNIQYRKTCLTLPLVTKTASSSEPLSISIRQAAFDLTKLLIRNAMKSFLPEYEYWMPSNSTIW